MMGCHAIIDITMKMVIDNLPVNAEASNTQQNVWRRGEVIEEFF